MKRNFITLVIVLLGFLLIDFQPHDAFAASNKENLQWKTYKFRGFYNEYSKFEGTMGIADKILAHYMKEMSGYEHTTSELPNINVFKVMEMVDEGGFIAPGKTKPPIDQMNNVLESTIQLVMPSPGVVVRKSDLGNYFSEEEDVSIYTLLNGEEQIVLGWFEGATFHPYMRYAVEDYLKRHEDDHPNLNLITERNMARIQLLLDGDIDYFPEHAIPYQYSVTDVIEELADKAEKAKTAAENAAKATDVDPDTDLGVDSGLDQEEELDELLSLDEDAYVDLELDEIDSLDKDIAVEEDSIVSLNEDIVKEEDSIVSLSEGVIEEKDALVSSGEDIVKEEDSIVSLSEDVVEEKDALVSPGEDVVKEEDSIVALSENLVEEKDAIVSLSEDVAKEEDALVALDENADIEVDVDEDAEVEEEEFFDYSDSIAYLRVKESKDDIYIYTYAADTEIGRRVIKHINQIHQSKEYKEFLKDLIKEHYPENLVDEYIEINMEKVGTEEETDI